MKLFLTVFSQVISSIMEILEHNYNALISPAGNDHVQSKNIQLLLKEHSIGERLGENAFQDVLDFTWEARVRYLQEIFRQ
jgi:glycosyltransferase involved in cell wall biosynthesis